MTTKNMYLKYWLRFIIVGTSITSWFLCKSPNKLNEKLQKMQTGICRKVSGHAILYWGYRFCLFRRFRYLILEIFWKCCIFRQCVIMFHFCYSTSLILQNHNLIFFFNLFYCWLSDMQQCILVYLCCLMISLFGITTSFYIRPMKTAEDNIDLDLRLILKGKLLLSNRCDVSSVSIWRHINPSHMSKTGLKIPKG